MPAESKSPKRKRFFTNARKQRLGGSALMLFLMALGCVPLYFGIQGAREARETTSWPTAPGRIIKSTSRVEKTKTSSRKGRRGSLDGRRGGGISESHYVDLEYEYKVDGVTHLGTQISVIAEEFGDKEYTEILLKKYPVGREVTVSYKPGHPGQAVLEPGHLGGAVFFLFLGGGLIVVPLLVLPLIWSSEKSEIERQGLAGEQRQRFDLVFRERFLEWEPGQRIHLHRDHLGFVSVVIKAVCCGLIFGAFLGVPLGFWLFTGRELILIAQFYLAVSTVLALIFGVSIGLDGRRRDTVIDWGRHTVRLQVGWTTREVDFEEIQKLALQIPDRKLPADTESTEPSQSVKTKKSKKSKMSKRTLRANEARITYPVRIVLHAHGKSHVLLQVESPAEAVPETRERLQEVAQELAASLNVSVA